MKHHDKDDLKLTEDQHKALDEVIAFLKDVYQKELEGGNHHKELVRTAVSGFVNFTGALPADGDGGLVYVNSQPSSASAGGA